MKEVLVSGKHSFKIEVPYKVIETGPKGSKPLILYLHGYNQNKSEFEEECGDFIKKINAYHLFIQGPYPLYDRTRKKKVSEWGRAWYLYDGNRGQFIKSLEISSQFLQEVIDRLLPLLEVNRIAVIGYSMGGYLAGYFAFTRWKHVNELAVCGARLKTEVIGESWQNLNHMNILAVHGTGDQSVSAENQQKEIESLSRHKIKSTFKPVEEGHSFSGKIKNVIIDWLVKNGYKKSEIE